MISLGALLLATVAPIEVAVEPKLESGSISASSATYDGALLILDGDVFLDHSFGNMQAEKAVLTKAESSNLESPFTSIELAESVHLKLSTQAEVDCERASLDFLTMQATLTSPKNVHYSDTLNSTPFEIFSPHLDIEIIKESHDLKTAHAYKGVHLIYDSLYHLKADSIVFSQGTLQSEGEKECVWTYQNGLVRAKTFSLDLTQKLLHLVQATGTLETLNFASDDLSWDHTQNHLVLKGLPKVHESSLGTITSLETIDLTLRDQKLHHLKTSGATELTSLKGHTLSTTGSIEVDSDKKIAFVTSDTSQLKYNEEEMTLLSDYAEIFYSEDGDELHPKKVELQGNIKVFSQEKEGPTRKGVADTLTYDPVSRSCILKANPGKKVLFTREEDKLSISANEIHITYNAQTKQQEVRGIGHITLSLTPHEQNLLNQVFKHVPSTP